MNKGRQFTRQNLNSRAAIHLQMNQFRIGFQFMQIIKLNGLMTTGIKPRFAHTGMRVNKPRMKLMDTRPRITASPDMSVNGKSDDGTTPEKSQSAKLFKMWMMFQGLCDHGCLGLFLLPCGRQKSQLKMRQSNWKQFGTQIDGRGNAHCAPDVQRPTGPFKVANFIGITHIIHQQRQAENSGGKEHKRQI